MLSIHSIVFASALGVPGVCDMWETIILIQLSLPVI